MILSILAVLLTFGLVIFLHESGHFFLCKALKVRVDQFAFGFGPEIYGFTKGETRFSICALPLGGFVKPAGENMEECKGAPEEYFSKPWNKRLMIVAAGPLMNYVLAFTLFTGSIYWMGDPQPSELPILGEVVDAYPAKQAGLLKEDKILQINAAKVLTWKDMAEKIHKSPDKPVTLTVERTKSELATRNSQLATVFKVTLTPRLDPSGTRGMIGISPKINYTPVTFFRAAKEGLRQCYYWTAYTIVTLGSKIYKREKPDLAGPVGIIQMVSRAAHSGLEDLIFLIALISVAVGFFNLLPIPLLDGGHAALYIWEGLSGKKLTEKTVRIANSFGLAILLSILIFATYSDISRLRSQNKPTSTETPSQQKP
ncbi:MAG: site-2 protease family protein [Elusimicrobia bacterium]|nr:site-2 protease family protein [Elusimicrobiota bacterium]